MIKLRIASRSSNLALLQAKEIMAAMPSIPYEITEMHSMGDKDKTVSLSENTIPDFFTRELDQAVLTNSCDIGIHSAKDLPFPLPTGLSLFALTRAYDKTDALISNNKLKLDELPAGTRIGTSSQSRKNQVYEVNHNVKLVDIRGSIEERIALIKFGKIDALVVATCALKRLGLESKLTEILPFDTHPLQGNLAVIGRTADWRTEELFSELDIRKDFGKVTIVGFGPGNPDYLTIKGFKALENADLIIYDDLIDQNYIKRFHGEKKYAGKRKNKHSYNQESINEILYHAAVSGKNTVRLKGGDPSIFGRIGEEIKYLQERFIETEIVPGITTASAASALSGMPLTQRQISSSVAFCSGHTLQQKEIPVADTLVFYMGGTTVHEISKKLILKGWGKDTPLAIISNVSLPEQTIRITTLCEISLSLTKVTTPAIILVGKTIDKDFIRQFTNNKAGILVTGTSASGYENFAKVIHTPLIEIQGVENAEIINSINKLHEVDIIIFTSRYGVEHFFKNLYASKKDSRYLSGCQIVSIGKTTTKKLYEFGITPDIQPEDESSAGILQYFRKKGVSGKKILIPRSNLAMNTLPEGLSELGNHVELLRVYNNILPDSVKKINLDSVRFVAFSSPSCVNNFFSIYKSFPEHLRFVVKGQETKKKLISASGKFDTEAPKLINSAF